MQVLGNTMTPAIGRLRVAVQALRAVWRRDLPTHARHDFLSAVLTGLNSLQLIRHLYQAVPTVFSVDVFSADEVRMYMTIWLQQSQNRIIPF
jgi:hypothetical protein